MAIYHLSMQIISRSKGQSSIASASYRSGEKLTDERTNETKYYHREVKPETMILTPSNSPSWAKDRNRLWNEVEKVEKRKDSQLARELNIALPRELSNEQQKELIQTFAQNEFVNKGMIADIAIHRDDNENPHAHIMLTMRNIDEKGFGKKNRDWNADFANAKENNRGFVKSVDKCLSVREQWANYANKALEKAQVNERISHLSNEARGLETLPTVHLGHVASKMENEGRRSERGDINRERQEYNAAVIDLQKVREEKQRLEKEIQEKKKSQDFSTDVEKVAIKRAVPIVKGYVTLEKVEKRLQQLNHWEAKLEKEQPRFFEKQDQFNLVDRNFKQQQSIQNQILEKQQKLNELNKGFLSRFKNNDLKRDIESSVLKLEKELKRYEDAIDDYRSSLGFTTYQDFQQKHKELFVEKEEAREKVSKEKGVIKEQRSILENAEKALKQVKIREVTSHFPDLKTLDEPITYNKALELEEFYKLRGKGGTIAELKADVSKLDETYNKRQQNYRLYTAMKENVNEATLYYRKLTSTIDKMNHNDADHKALKKEASHYKEQIKILGYEDLDKFEKDVKTIQKVEPRVPEMQKTLDNQKSEIDLLSSLVSAIEQAQQAQQARENKPKSSLTRNKGRSKKKQHEQGFELGG